jgi:hypothetical protein
VINVVLILLVVIGTSNLTTLYLISTRTDYECVIFVRWVYNINVSNLSEKYEFHMDGNEVPIRNWGSSGIKREVMLHNEELCMCVYTSLQNSH